MTIRPLTDDDADEVTRLHSALPERDRYLRFFTPYLPPRFGATARSMITPADAHRLALGAFLDGRLVGVGNVEALADPAVAEVAMAVDHAQQAHGVGTLGNAVPRKRL